MAADFLTANALEHWTVVVSKPWLQVVNEQRPDASDEKSKWNVDEPVDTEVQYCENEQKCVD